MQLVKDTIDRFLGRGRHSTSVPVMDGPLQPDQRLETAPVLALAPELDNLVTLGDALFCSSGAQLLQITERGAVATLRLAAPIACLAAGSGRALAVGLDGKGLQILGGRHDGRSVEMLGDQRLVCPTAALFLDAHTLLVASGSDRFAAGQWKHDLMTRGRSGSIWRIDLRSGAAERLARGLGFPYGLALSADGGKVLASEAWEHRVIELDLRTGGAAHPVLEDLPAYPARLANAAGGGYWLALFAPRNQLIEFVLRERRYRERMIAEVDPQFWIAPSLASRTSFREPMQSAALKQMGMLKPWAPSFSYGLVARLDEQLLPVASWHSRADGSVHGVTSLCEHAGRLVVAARGCGRAVHLNLPSPEAAHA